MTMYQIHGDEELTMKRQSYTGEFKINVVKYMHSIHLSIREASTELVIPSNATLLKWERIYYEEGPQGLLFDRRGRPRKIMNEKPEIKKKTEEDLIAETAKIFHEIKGRYGYRRVTLELKKQRYMHQS